MKPRTALAITMLCFALHVDGETPQSYLLDPFAQATSGHEGCTPAKPPLLDEQQMRSQAHSRAERGTSCCLAGTCECGGPYKHDAEINDRVIEAIRADKRFRDTAVWVATTRGFVSLQGCVRGPGQKTNPGSTRSPTFDERRLTRAVASARTQSLPPAAPPPPPASGSAHAVPRRTLSARRRPRPAGPTGGCAAARAAGARRCRERELRRGDGARPPASRSDRASSAPKRASPSPRDRG